MVESKPVGNDRRSRATRGLLQTAPGPADLLASSVGVQSPDDRAGALGKSSKRVGNDGESYFGASKLRGRASALADPKPDHAQEPGHPPRLLR